VTATPWGDLQTLCSQRLRPGPGGARDEVERNQRERLFAATVATVAERGYAATRVADVIEVARISRSTFYREFESLHDCFVQTLDAIVVGVEAAMLAALEGERPWDERLRGSFETLIDLVAAQPAAARLCFVEAYVAGPEAVARIDRTARAVGRRVLAVVAESPERADMPREVAGAVLGGLRTVIQVRLYTGRERELPGLAPQLMDWALGYRTPPVALPRPRRRPAAPPGPVRDSLDPRQRIVDALTAVVAQRGYGGTTITEIADFAEISLSTFYGRFENKEAALLAAFDDAMLRMLEVGLPAYRQAEDWAQGVRDGIETLLAYLSHEPDTAELAAQAVWAGGPPAVTRIEESMSGFRALLAEGLRGRSGASGVAAEAIGASILALGYDHLARRGPKRLYQIAPTAAFVALAPAIGTLEACTVVTT